MDRKLINKLKLRIGITLLDYYGDMVSCKSFTEEFKGFYPPEFLSRCYYVVVK